MAHDALATIKEQNDVRRIIAKARQAFGLDRDTWLYVDDNPPGFDAKTGSDIDRAVQATARFATGRLALDKRPPDVRWFRPLTEPEMQYIADKGLGIARHDLFDDAQLIRSKRQALGAFDDAGYPTIWVRNDLSAPDAMAVTLHETGHAAGMNETDAEAFEAKWSNRLDLLDPVAP